MYPDVSKVDVDMLNAVNSMLANVSSVSPSEPKKTLPPLFFRSDEGLTLETSANTLFTAFSISKRTCRFEMP